MFEWTDEGVEMMQEEEREPRWPNAIGASPASALVPAVARA